MSTIGSTNDNRATVAPSRPQAVEPCECGGKPLGFSCDPRCPASGEENPVNPAHLREYNAEFFPHQ